MFRNNEICIQLFQLRLTRQSAIVQSNCVMGMVNNIYIFVLSITQLTHVVGRLWTIGTLYPHPFSA
jgi:hypothetical protein